MTSMTGYAYKEINKDEATVSVEIKSVNSRFLDLSINLPSYLNQIECRFKELITQKVQRGKIDVFIRIKEKNPSEKITANVNVAKEYLSAISEIAKSLGRKEDEIPLSLIISQNDVLKVENVYDVEKYWLLTKDVFEDALKSFVSDREREGKNLYNDLSEKLSVLDNCSVFFKEWQPKMESLFKEQIVSRFHELLGNAVDETRIMTELAAMLVKYTINEEIVRLLSHLKALHFEMENNATPGKKIDFICQEINREINTIGSKNQFAEVGAVVVNAKDALENIREQSKNIE